MYETACQADLQDHASAWNPELPTATEDILEASMMVEPDGKIDPALEEFFKVVTGSSVDECKKNDCLNVCYD